MTSLAELPSYTLMQLPPDLTGEPPDEAALKADFEKGDTKTKITALKKVLYFILNGEKFPGLLMTIIRFVLPSQVNFQWCVCRQGTGSAKTVLWVFSSASRKVHNPISKRGDG